jgi:hypothetical protein
LLNKPDCQRSHYQNSNLQEITPLAASFYIKKLFELNKLLPEHKTGSLNDMQLKRSAYNASKKAIRSIAGNQNDNSTASKNVITIQHKTIYFFMTQFL